jgi:Arabinose-binding domain of AraC transcription regulator, N-term
LESLSFDAFIRMLEASADDLQCPDFGLRLSSRQGLHILGPLAVIARNAQTVLSGVEAIGRYLYIHSPALELTERRTERGIEFAYDMTEPSVLYPLQGYELSMGISVRILRLLGGPEARFRAISFMHEQRGSDTAYRDALDCPVRFGQTWCGFELPTHLAERRIENADPETRRIATKYLEATYLPGTAPLSARVAELARRLLPTGQCSADAIADELAMHPPDPAATAGHRRRALPGRHRPGTPHPGGAIPHRTGIASQPDRRSARLHRAERAQPFVSTLVRKDTAAVPGERAERRVLLDAKCASRSARPDPKRCAVSEAVEVPIGMQQRGTSTHAGSGDQTVESLTDGHASASRRAI